MTVFVVAGSPPVTLDPGRWTLESCTSRPATLPSHTNAIVIVIEPRQR